MKYVCTVCGYVYEGESLPADSSVQYVRHQQASLLHRQEKENGLLSTLLA